MKNSYVNQLMESKTICVMNDERTIITDRMGNWNKQDVVLTWEGNTNNGIVSITPDEVEILFANGLTKNIVRGENGKLCRKFTHLDIRKFSGAIVCGVLAPSTQADLRQEILDYAKKMGYVTDTMTPVEMTTGIKSLIFNADGTYNVFYRWHDGIMKKIGWELLINFTKDFFDNQEIDIANNGVLMKNLSEKEVFSRENIDIFRSYDIQLFYLNSEFDKTLLLRAVMQRAFIHLPCNTLRKGQFEKSGSITIPEDKQENIKFDEFGVRNMKCGKAYHDSEGNRENYRYQITVPYTEFIRELMIDTEKVLRERFGKNVFVSFSGYGQDIFISYCENECVNSAVERELLSLDYAIYFLQKETEFNSYQLYASIISLLEADSDGKFRDEYFSYLKTLKYVLPEKCEFM